jgi:hypothetical protein
MLKCVLTDNRTVPAGSSPPTSPCFTSYRENE